MLVFIDESGIHTKNNHSTVALVYIIVKDLGKIDKAVIETEKSLRISSFHWARHNWKIRYKFVEMLSKENFTVKAVIINNPFTENDFEKAIESLLTERKLKNIIIDGKKPKRYILRLKKVLRDRGISVKKIRTGNDKSFPCLRLADVFAGLIRAYWDDKDGDEAKKLFKIANKKITTQLVGGQIIK